METVLWAGILFAALACALQFVIRENTRDLVALVTLCFLASLTRPESILLAGSWFIVLLWLMRSNRTVIGGALVFVALGATYLVWAQIYFGDFLPNSFYIKVDRTLSALPGSSYVADLLREHRVLVGLSAICLALNLSLPTRPFGLTSVYSRGLVNRTKQQRALLLFCTVFSLVPFYLLIEPLMGMYFRFLYPAHVVLTALGVLAVARLWPALHPGIDTGAGRANLLNYGLFAFRLFVLFFFPSPIYSTVRELARPRADRLFDAEVRVGKALRNISANDRMLLAFGDAGVVPYYSEAQVLDVIGLNNNEIARYASKRGPDWIIEYILSAEPDLIGFYSNPGGSIFDKGHGIIGGSYSKLYCHALFQRDYRYVDGFDFGWAHLQWFSSRNSRYYATLKEMFIQIADFTEYDFVVPQECAQ